MVPVTHTEPTPVEDVAVATSLADGRQVFVRQVRPTDIDELRRAIRDADPDTIRQRFLGGRPPQTDAELRRLVELDHRTREAMAAFTAEGRGVGIARYELLPGGTCADVAVAVDPEWRRVGLARTLLTRLLTSALNNGISTIHVDYAATNQDVRDLIHTVSGVTETISHGVAAVDLPIPGAVRALDD